MDNKMAKQDELKLIPFYRKVLLIQYQRFKEKGLRILWAVLHLYILVSIVPKLIRMIWPTLLEIFSEKVLFVGGVSLANFMAIILINLIILYVYLTGQKQNCVFYGQRVWKKNPQQWKSLLKQTILRQLFTNLVLLPAVILPLYYLIGDKIVYKCQFPSEWQMLKQGLILLLLQDVTSSNSHRLLHSKSLYWIHKKHHEYREPISISAQFAHPIQLVFNNFAGSAVGYIFLSFFQQLHIVTGIIWVLFRVTDATVNHSGYSFDWSILQLIPFATGSEFHSFHHTHNTGNISSMFIFWDLIAGTYSDYVDYKINLMCNKKK